jgi:hypothetical protein
METTEAESRVDFWLDLDSSTIILYTVHFIRRDKILLFVENHFLKMTNRRYITSTDLGALDEYGTFVTFELKVKIQYLSFLSCFDHMEHFVNMMYMHKYIQLRLVYSVLVPSCRVRYKKKF